MLFLCLDKTPCAYIFFLLIVQPIFSSLLFGHCGYLEQSDHMSNTIQLLLCGWTYPMHTNLCPFSDF